MFFSPCFLSLRSCLLNYDMADMAESGAGSAEVASDRDTVTLADAAAASDDFGKSSSATMQEQMRAEEAEYMTRYSLEWNSGVACWSQERRSEDPISDYDSPMPAPKRAPRACKYGRCSVHGCPFKVHPKFQSDLDSLCQILGAASKRKAWMLEGWSLQR